MATFAGFATLGSVVFAVAGVVVLALMITVFKRRSPEPIDAADEELGEFPDSSQRAFAPVPAMPTLRTVPRVYWVVLGCFALAAVLGVLGAVRRSPDSVDRLVAKIQTLEQRLTAAEVELEAREVAAAALEAMDGRSARTVGGGPKRESGPNAASDPRPEETSTAADAPSRPPATEAREALGRSPAPTAPKTSAPSLSIGVGTPRSERDARRPAPPAWASPATTTVEHEQAVAYHSPQRLLNVRKGQAKEVVFGLFGTAFVNRDGNVVEIQGMRLLPSSRPANGTRFEVSRVMLGEDDGPKTSYWFLFEAGRLLTWGRPEEWRATASRYKPDLPDRLEF